jgi:co-chaperonin GroES (HSP10)
MNGSDYLWSKKEGIYWCPKDFVYARVRKGKVKMLGNWNFIRPIITEPPRSESGIYLTSEPKAFAFRKGIVAHMSDGMKELGLKIGDKIGFSKNSEYDMEIEGEKLYRMRDKDILYKIEE